MVLDSLIHNEFVGSDHCPISLSLALGPHAEKVKKNFLKEAAKKDLPKAKAKVRRSLT